MLIIFNRTHIRVLLFMKKHLYLFISILFLLAFIVFTILVKTVDVRYIYNNTYLGFYELNFKFGFKVVEFGKYDSMKTISDVLLYIAIAYSGILGIFGLIQLIKNKSFKKVDKRFYILLGMYLFIAFVYLLFELIKVNYSPESTKSVLKASYPSSHVFIGCSLLLLNSYTSIKLLNPEKSWLTYLVYLSTGLICVLLTFTRLLSLKHWLTDVIASVILVGAIYFAFIYISHRLVVTSEKESLSNTSAE